MLCFIFIPLSVVMGSNNVNTDAEFKPDIFDKEEIDIEDVLSHNEFRNVSRNLSKPFHLLPFFVMDSKNYARHCFLMIANIAEEYPQKNKTLLSPIRTSFNLH